MGITNLLGLLTSIVQKRHLREYRDQVAAVDVYTWLHPSIYTCRYEMACNIPTTKHIDFCVKRVETLLSYGIKKVVLVFDGRQLPSKKSTEESREKNRETCRNEAQNMYQEGTMEANLIYNKFAQSIDVTPQMAYDFIKAIRGNPKVEIIVSPYEADAQLAYLSQTSYVDVVISEDSDLLAFGCKKVLFKLFKGEQKSKYDSKDTGDEICLDNLKHCTKINLGLWNQNMFLMACILSGCDYLHKIQKIGPDTAFKLVRDFQPYNKCILAIQSKFDASNEYLAKFDLAFLTFRFQYVYSPQQDKIVNLNTIEFEGMRKHFVDKEYIDKKTQDKWKYFEDNILLSHIVYKILHPAFSWDFLGDMDNETAMNVVKAIIDPETLKPYKQGPTLIQGLGFNHSVLDNQSAVQRGLGLGQGLGLSSLQAKGHDEYRHAKTLPQQQSRQSTLQGFIKKESAGKTSDFLEQTWKARRAEEEPTLAQRINLFGDDGKGMFDMIEEEEEEFGKMQSDGRRLPSKSPLKKPFNRELLLNCFDEAAQQKYITVEAQVADNKNISNPDMLLQNLAFNASNKLQLKLNSVISKNLQTTRSGLQLDQRQEEGDSKHTPEREESRITRIVEEEEHPKEHRTSLEEIQYLKRRSSALAVVASDIRRIEVRRSRSNSRETVLHPSRSSIASALVEERALGRFTALKADSIIQQPEGKPVVQPQLEILTNEEKVVKSAKYFLNKFTQFVDGKILIDSEYLLNKHPSRDFLRIFSEFKSPIPTS